MIWQLRRNPSDKLKNVLTMGVYDGHAFLLKNIERPAKTYVCVHCRACFTEARSLQLHANRCAQGKTVIDCPNERVEAPQTAYERAFTQRIKLHQQRLRGFSERAGSSKNIHHAMCGHDGERWIEGAPVDGYGPTTKTVFQYHGCYWLGCRPCFPNDRIVENNQTREERYLAKIERTRKLRLPCYRVIEKWECTDLKTREELPKVETRSYPIVIFYDFESYQDKKQRREATSSLTFENVHMPISVSIGDTLEREPKHICDAEPKELMRPQRWWYSLFV